MASLFVIIELVVIVGLVGWLRVVRRERSDLQRAYRRVLSALQAGEATTSVLRQARILPQRSELPRRGLRDYGLLLLAAFRRDVAGRPLVSAGAVALTALLAVSATMFSYPGVQEQRALQPSRAAEAPRLLPPQPAGVAPLPALPEPAPSGDAAGRAPVVAVEEPEPERSGVVRAVAHVERPAADPAPVRSARAAPVEPARPAPPERKAPEQRSPQQRSPHRPPQQPQRPEDGFGRWTGGEGDGDDGSWRREADDGRRGEDDRRRHPYRGGDRWERRERSDDWRSWRRGGREEDGYRAERERSYPGHHDRRSGGRHGDGWSSGDRFSWQRSR